MTMFDIVAVSLSAASTIATIAMCVKAYRLERENEILKAMCRCDWDTVRQLRGKGR